METLEKSSTKKFIVRNHTPQSLTDTSFTSVQCSVCPQCSFSLSNPSLASAWLKSLTRDICCARVHPTILNICHLCVTSTSEDFLQRSLDEGIGFGSCWRKWRLPKKSNQDQKPNYRARGDLQVSNHLVRLLRKSKKVSCLAAESTNESTGRPVESCVPVSVERVDKDKDADENEDADQTSAERPVKSGQSIGLFTQRDEMWNKQKTSAFANSWRRWPRRWGPQRMRSTGGGGLARVPNLRVCKHPTRAGGTAGRERWINILPWYRPVGVAQTSSETGKRESRAAKKGKWPPRGPGTTVLTNPCPSQPCFGGSKVCARVTGLAGENGQNSGEPIVVRGLSTSSSTSSTSPTSSSKEIVTDTEIPATRRSENASEESQKSRFFLCYPNDNESKRKMKMFMESWKFQCQQRCFVDFNFANTKRPVAQFDNTRRNMLVL